MTSRSTFRQPGLRFYFVVGVVLPLLLALGAVSYLTLQAIEERAQHQMEEDVQLVARAIRLPLGRALERDRPGSVDEALESAFRINRVYGAYVYDVEGALVASVGEFNLATDKQRLADLAEQGDRRGEYEQIGGRSVYSYFVPLTGAGGRVNGLLQVTRRASDIRQYLTRLRWQAIGFLLTTMVLITGLVLYGHHWAIGTHLNHLSETMARVRGGDLSSRAKPRGPKEIASLGAALNTMLESIVEARAEVLERRQAQIDLEKRLQHAQKLAAIGQLSAGVAHELGTPLSVIDGKAQRALRKDDLPAPLEQALHSIRGEVRRMERIVRQLLDFGRRNVLEARAVRLDRLAQMAAAGVRDACEQSGVTLELEGPRPAPVVEVDPTLIERALVNLLRNAIDATPGGHVQLAWTATDDGVGLVVEDDGPGVDPAVRDRLFEPFFTTKGVGEGTGLGLAVVHGIVEEHGGRVEVDTSPRGGARFRIVLPLDRAAVSEETLA